MVVVADAGMLSAANLNRLDDAGFSFIVGSRLVKAPYDLADHFARHGNYFTDGQILESAREMGTGKNAHTRRVIYQWKFKRQKHDDRTINLMIAKAEKIAAGTTALRKARFLKVTGATKELDQVTIDRARQLAGLKGYVTNLPAEQMAGQAVIDTYHDLWQVERSFRMTKSDLVEVVVGVDHPLPVHRRGRQVRDVALQTGQLPGPVDQPLIELLGGAGDLDEPGLGHRGRTGGDLLRAGDHRVDRPVVVAVARELVLVDHPPGSGGLARAHDPGGLQDLPVCEVVPVTGEVLSQVIGRLADP